MENRCPNCGSDEYKEVIIIGAVTGKTLKEGFFCLACDTFQDDE